MANPVNVVLDEINKIMDDFIDRVFQLSQENLVTDGKSDTGFLLKSGNVQRDYLNKEITYSAPYASVIEFGRTPGHPMYSGWLENWVRRKLGISDPKEIKKVSFAIAKSIEKRGIAESPYLRPAIEQAALESGVSPGSLKL